MLIPNHFSFYKSLFMNPIIIGWVNNFPICKYQPYYYKLSQPYSPHYYACLVLYQMFIFVPFLLCLTLVVIRKKRHEFSTFLITLVWRIAFLPVVEL